MLFVVIIGVLIAACDQIIKLIVVSNAAVLPIVIPGVVSIVFVKNTGAAFSILQGGRVFFLIFTPIVLAAMLWLVRKGIITGRVSIAALAMVFGGALGNFVDRAVLGYVIDYVQPEFINFAVFNLADCFVVIGCLLFLIYTMFFEGRKKADVPAEDDQRTD